jgi:hypothetical protein
MEGSGGRGTSKLNLVEFGNILQFRWVCFVQPWHQLTQTDRQTDMFSCLLTNSTPWQQGTLTNSSANSGSNSTSCNCDVIPQDYHSSVQPSNL